LAVIIHAAVELLNGSQNPPSGLTTTRLNEKQAVSAFVSRHQRSTENAGPENADRIQFNALC